MGSKRRRRGKRRGKRKGKRGMRACRSKLPKRKRRAMPPKPMFLHLRGAGPHHHRGEASEETEEGVSEETEEGTGAMREEAVTIEEEEIDGEEGGLGVWLRGTRAGVWAAETEGRRAGDGVLRLSPRGSRIDLPVETGMEEEAAGRGSTGAMMEADPETDQETDPETDQETDQETDPETDPETDQETDLEKKEQDGGKGERDR